MQTEIDKREKKKNKEEEASPNFSFHYKEITQTGDLIALFRCRTCEESFPLGKLLNQLGEEELIALKNRINRRLT
jgi:hypothetical protein